MTIKDELHRLVEELPEGELQSAKRFLEYLRNMGDPLLQALMAAPYDDEPTTPEEDKGAEEAWQEYLRGEARPWEEVRKELEKE
ncbi:MAG TPA: hypothetical protein VI855_00675 [Dehalococcoidia bacterium]|nr:hypothetical protein [Dehalococcoidia bacterium]